jgi:hypothetical protein
MTLINPLYVLLGGAVLLAILLNERLRTIAALFTFVIVILAAAKLMGAALPFWK